MPSGGDERALNVDESLLGESAEELYESAPCGYLSTLPDGRIVRVNQTFLKWTSYSRERLSRSRFSDLLNPPGKIFYETRALTAGLGHENATCFDRSRSRARRSWLARRGRLP